MRIVTVATDLENRFLKELLAPSCAAVGLDLVVLHLSIGSFTFSDKRVVLAKYLSDLADLDELILFTDAYDTLFIRGERHIEEAYDRLGKPLVFSAELNSWPLGVVGIALEAGPPVGRYPYLNSGGFIGVAGDILDLCTRYRRTPSDRFDLLRLLRTHGYDTDEQFAWSDQYHWTLVRHLERESIGLDHDASLFEYFGPPIRDVVHREVMRDVHEFERLGTASAVYRRELERLSARLAVPSAAAQVHFASSMTKAAALALLDGNALPDWLTPVWDSTTSDGPRVQVYRM
jgi:hypothetical protein